MAERNLDQEQNTVEKPNEGQPIPIKLKTKNEEPIRVTDKRFWVQPENESNRGETSFSLKPSYVEELEKKLSDSQKRLDELIAAYRALKVDTAAETQKARERIQNEYNKRLVQARADVARKFINVLENLDRALTATQESKNFESLLEGVKLIRNQFNTALSDLGLEEIKVKGEPFNPEIAEAVQTAEVENEAEDNLVLEVISKGYRINDTLVRPAQVKVGVSKAPIPESAAS
ncbi:MAG: nucleotide exchange factor GrpE [Acidobacteria bacterium]|nr:MAG: nucleotide exchange factor GrpE [Acidobacteriota bacterium]